jgi:arylsulfatase A-like enzyme
MTADRIRVLVVLFDGLRPDLIGPATTPHLHRLQQQGVTLGRQRTVYPSETRIALTSLVTGAPPGRHGIVGNAYLDRAFTPPRYINTGEDHVVEALDAAADGRLIGAPSLGEVLAAHGRTLAVLASNSAGATRILNHKARHLGHLTLSGHYPTTATSTQMLAALEARLGPLPAPEPQGTPDLAAQQWLTSAFLDVVWPELMPDVTILSFGEPDFSSHYSGTAAPETLRAIAFVDTQFGRVLDWWDAEGRNAGVQIMTASDHGHVTAHSRATVGEVLATVGLRCGRAGEPGIDAVLIPSQVGALYFREPSDEIICRAVAAMTQAPWCGPIFTAARNGIEGIAPGSFARHLAFAEHARSADIMFAYRADDRPDPFGLSGGTWSPDWPLGFGIHGGLHEKEMASVGMMAGSAFKSGAMSQTPSGIGDFAPTILSLLEIGRPDGMTGRTLQETFSRTAADLPPTKEEAHETALGAYRQGLLRRWVGDTAYLDRGWAEDR